MVYKRQRFNYHSSGGEKSEIRVPTRSGEGPVPCHRPLLVLPRGRVDQEALQGLFFLPINFIASTAFFLFCFVYLFIGCVGSL